MNNTILKRLAHALMSRLKNALAHSLRRQNIIVSAGAAAVVTLGLPLLYQLATEPRDIVGASPLASAYHNDGYIALACFAAVAAGYCYLVLQTLARGTGVAKSRRLARWSDASFLTVLGSIVAALLLWNIGMLVH